MHIPHKYKRNIFIPIHSGRFTLFALIPYILYGILSKLFWIYLHFANSSAKLTKFSYLNKYFASNYKEITTFISRKDCLCILPPS